MDGSGEDELRLITVVTIAVVIRPQQSHAACYYSRQQSQIRKVLPWVRSYSGSRVETRLKITSVAILTTLSQINLEIYLDINGSFSAVKEPLSNCEAVE